MRNVLLLLLLLFIPTLSFADTKISQMTADTSPANADVFPIVKGTDGLNYKVALSDLKTYIGAGGGTWGSITGTITAQNWASPTPYLQHDAVNWTDANIFTTGSTSNIGIGSPNPGQVLDVTGTVRASGFIAGGNIGIGTATTPSNRLKIIGVGNTNATSGIVYKDSALDNLLVVNDIGGVSIGTGNLGSALTLKSNIAGESVHIETSNANSTSNGPTLTLAQNPIGSPTAVTPGTYLGSIWAQGDSVSSGNGDITTGGEIRFIGSNATWTDFASAPTTIQFLTASTSGTARNLVMSVTDTQNVGIGTSIPAEKLGIVGGVAIGTNANIGLGAPSNGLYVQGNVGVGSLTPGTALDVQGSVRLTGLVSSGSTGITATCGTTAVNSITIKNGVITGCTGT